MKSIWMPILVSIALISVVFVSFENLETYFQWLLEESNEHKIRFSALSFLVLSSDILLPVPSSIVMYTNGLVLGLFLGSMLSLMASLVSAGVGYYLGRFTNWGKSKPNEKAQYVIEKYGALSIIITRGIPILSETISFTSGYNKIKVKPFLLLNFIGYLPICMIYAFFGTLGQDSGLFLLSFVSSIIVSAIMWFFGKKLIQNRLLENV